MSKTGTKVEIICEHDIKLLKCMVELYALSIEFKYDRPKLRKKLIHLLTYYVKYGYSRETKDIAAQSLKVKLANINVMNLELTKMGYLITDKHNNHKKDLNKDLISLRNCVGDDVKQSGYIFVFKLQ